MASIPQDETPEIFVTALIDGRPNPIEFFEICISTLGASGFDVFEVDTSRYMLTSNEGEYPRVVDKTFINSNNYYGPMSPRLLSIFTITKPNSEYIVDAFPVYFTLEVSRDIHDGEKSHMIRVFGQRKDIEEMAHMLAI